MASFVMLFCWLLHLGADLGMTNVSATSLAAGPTVISQEKLRENAANRELAKAFKCTALLKISGKLQAVIHYSGNTLYILELH